MVPDDVIAELPDGQVPDSLINKRTTVLPKAQLKGELPVLHMLQRDRYEEMKDLGEGAAGDVLLAKDNDIQRLVGDPFVLGFANANDGRESGIDYGLRFLPHDCVSFAMIGSSFRMSHDDKLRTGIRQHEGRNIARMGTAFRHVAILRANCDLPGRRYRVLDFCQRHHCGRQFRLSAAVQPAA